MNLRLRNLYTCVHVLNRISSPVSLFSSTTCPSDALVGAGVVCRPSAGCNANNTLQKKVLFLEIRTSINVSREKNIGACDVVDVCSGVSAQCPADALAAVMFQF